MKNYIKMTRDGFTLVELMIVVAIIGVLASIAVPQYAKFQAKSRQSEVKIQLGAAYTVEQSFAAESSTYTACLGQVGYNRDGTKFYYTIGFRAGAAASTCTPGTAGGPTQTCDTYQWQYCDGSVGSVAPCAANTIGYTQALTGSCTAGLYPLTNGTDVFPANIVEPVGTNYATTAAAVTAVTTKANLPATTATMGQGVFTIGAVGYILKNNSAVATAGVPAGVDAWTIDQSKQIMNVQSGLQ